MNTKNMNASLPKIRVSVTNDCQLNCKFCGGSSGNMENFQPMELDGSILSTDKLLQIVNLYIKHGGDYVQLTGGEPLLRKDIVRIVSEIKAMGGIPEINTNAVALTQHMAYKLADAGLNILKVSIPALSSKKYFEITGKNYYEIIWKKLDSIAGIIPIRVNMVAMKSNMRYLRRSIEICKGHGINQLLLLQLLHYHSDRHDLEFFRDMYVDVVSQYECEVEEILGSSFSKVTTPNPFENSLYVANDNCSNFQLIVKSFDPVYRVTECDHCDAYCQEGIYELRLSTGGYLNLCNIPNKFGLDCSVSTIDDISKHFQYYKQLLDSIVEGDPSEFSKRLDRQR